MLGNKRKLLKQEMRLEKATIGWGLWEKKSTGKEKLCREESHTGCFMYCIVEETKDEL